MSKRLLLADDSITIQKVIQITFAHEDYELAITDNGDSAFARARELVPDLVLADVYMPGKNGYELCAAIKTEPALKHVPVLLLAGSFEPFDEGKARASGADAWIEKPFESQSLIDKVATLLGAAPAAAAPAPAVAPQPVTVPEPAPAPVDSFADISFEEPVAPAPVVPEPAPVPADAFGDISFEEPPAAAPVFEFAAEPFPVAEEPLAFEESALPAADFGAFGDTEEVMALGDDDILGAEDLEPAGEMPTLSPWSRSETPLETSFEALAEPQPLAFAPPIEPPVEPPAPSLAPAAPVIPAAPVAAPVAVPAAAPVAAPVAAAVVEQRVATLTETEIEQIVERAVGKVIEKLAGTVLERVAWEVVPDLAEALIKDEIRKIKDAAA
ncbi:MAG: response regulator [Desulfuromonas sp.]|nr:response regulator [Desulfuromonas sp.]